LSIINEQVPAIAVYFIEHYMQSLLTTSEVAKYLSLNPKVVSEKARTGEIPEHKRLGRWYFF